MTRLAVLVVLLGAACITEQEPAQCPTAGPGDLVVTEVRGDQGDARGEWIELINVGGAAVELRGLHLDIRKLDGSSPTQVIVRRSLVVAPGAYAVVGSFPDDARPAFVTYGWHPDLLGSGGAVQHLPDSGAVEVSACGVLIDRVVWNDLPSAGTYSLGLDPPDAVGNDPAAAWCANPAGDGANGTPGAMNPPCP